MEQITACLQRRPLRGMMAACTCCRGGPRTAEVRIGTATTYVGLQVCDSCADAIVRSAREEES